MTLYQYSRCNATEMSSDDTSKQDACIAVPERIRRIYPTDRRHIEAEPQSAVERIRRDRLLRGLSAAALARLADVTPRIVKYHEERLTSDDLIDTDYLKKVARGMQLPEDYYLDEYLHWGDSRQYVEDVQHYIKQSGLPLKKLYIVFGAREHAVNSWRYGKSRPPKRLFTLLCGGK